MTGRGRAVLKIDAPHFPNAACRPADANPETARQSIELFFGTYAERPRESAARETQAKALCATCPELHACRTWALGNPKAIGDDAVPHDTRQSPTYVGQIIGGLNSRERWAIRSGRPAPKPALTIVAPIVEDRRGGPLPPIQHGSPAGMSAHYRRNDLPPCDACKRAYSEARASRRRQPTA